MSETVVSMPQVMAARTLPQWKGVCEAALYRMLIRPVHLKEVTDGGIELPESVLQAKGFLRFVGQVVSIGPLCWKHPKFMGMPDPVDLGGWIGFGNYAGQTHMAKMPDDPCANARGWVPLKVLNDDEIHFVVHKPEDFVIYSD